MSHIVQIKTEVRDENCVRLACKRLGIEEPTSGRHTLFAGQTAEGLAVKLPNWHFPIVINLTSGAVDFDNYNGSWGSQKELDTFLQGYAIEKAKYEAQKGGYSVYEETLGDGSVKLTLTGGDF